MRDKGITLTTTKADPTTNPEEPIRFQLRMHGVYKNIHNVDRGNL